MNLSLILVLFAFLGFIKQHTTLYTYAGFLFTIIKVVAPYVSIFFSFNLTTIYCSGPECWEGLYVGDFAYNDYYLLAADRLLLTPVDPTTIKDPNTDLGSVYTTLLLTLVGTLIIRQRKKGLEIDLESIFAMNAYSGSQRFRVLIIHNDPLGIKRKILFLVKHNNIQECLVTYNNRQYLGMFNRWDIHDPLAGFDATVRILFSRDRSLALGSVILDDHPSYWGSSLGLDGTIALNPGIDFEAPYIGNYNLHLGASMSYLKLLDSIIPLKLYNGKGQHRCLTRYDYISSSQNSANGLTGTYCIIPVQLYKKTSLSTGLITKVYK